MRMVVTDEPMPGVAQPNSVALWLLARRGDQITLLTTFSLEKFEQAKKTAFSYAAEYDEVLVLDATMLYRAWQKDEEGKPRNCVV
jgi:hypothetical protein